MYRVLIAEDEVFVRLGLKMSVEWEKMDMRVIADAANGQQAWDIYEKEHPDIILTDIRMPVMDGMELPIRKTINLFEQMQSILVYVSNWFCGMAIIDRCEELPRALPDWKRKKKPLFPGRISPGNSSLLPVSAYCI